MGASDLEWEVAREPAGAGSQLLRSSHVENLSASTRQPLQPPFQAVAKAANLISAIALAFGEQPQQSIWSALGRQVRVWRHCRLLLVAKLSLQLQGALAHVKTSATAARTAPCLWTF